MAPVHSVRAQKLTLYAPHTVKLPLGTLTPLPVESPPRMPDGPPNPRGTMHEDPTLTFPQQLHCTKEKSFFSAFWRHGLVGRVTPLRHTVRGGGGGEGVITFSEARQGVTPTIEGRLPSASGTPEWQGLCGVCVSFFPTPHGFISHVSPAWSVPPLHRSTGRGTHSQAQAQAHTAPHLRWQCGSSIKAQSRASK